jgi:hypothetical protein
MRFEMSTGLCCYLRRANARAQHLSSHELQNSLHRFLAGSSDVGHWLWRQRHHYNRRIAGFDHSNERNPAKYEDQFPVSRIIGSDGGG